MEFLSNLFLGMMLYFLVKNLIYIVKGMPEEKKEFHKHDVVEGAEQEYPNELPPGVKSITFEVLNEHDVILCHDTDGNFLCQGKTMTEIQDNFRARFPEDAAVIVDPVAKALYQKMMLHEAP